MTPALLEREDTHAGEMPLLRALECLPHGVVMETHRQLVEAADHLQHKNDAGPLRRIALQIHVTASLESNTEFKLALKRLDAEPIEPTREGIDHRAHIERLRATA